MKPIWSRTLLLALLLVVLVPRDAHAYLDPGAGSMILQLVLGGLAGLAVGLRLIWRRIAGRFTRGGSPVADEPSNHPGEPRP